ncbi:MAG: ABC transporter permease [Oscillospiraceae bacterium]|nr:ABC transporter permease [Oscillospiraceae bacterium]
MRFKYSLLTLLRSKSYLFWTLAFPIILGTFFNVAFSGDLMANFEPIPIAVVEESGVNTMFNEILHQLADGETPMLRIVPATSLYEAETLLIGGEITGLFVLREDIELMVTRTGINQSILQTISNEFVRRSATITDIAAERPDLVMDIVAQMNAGIDVNQGTAGLGTDIVIYHFYALLAMVCFMGSQAGFKVSIDVQAGVSPLAARRSVAPTKKMALVVNEFFAAVLIHGVITFISVAYLVFILGINFGQSLPLILLVCFVGSLAGISFGMLMATVLKGKENVREATMTAITFVFYAAAGLFQSQIRLMVRNAAPIADRINPITLISDAFASLVIYDTLDRYFRSLLILLAMSALFLVVSAAVLRRARYADS